MDEIRKFIEERTSEVMDYNLEAIGARYFQDVPSLVAEETTKKFNTECMGMCVYSDETNWMSLYVFAFAYIDKMCQLQMVSMTFEHEI